MNDFSLVLISELTQTAQMIGSTKTIKLLVQGRAGQKPKKIGGKSKKNITRFIYRLLCERFQISQEELINGCSHGRRSNALMIGYVVCNRILNYSVREIAHIFKKDFSNVSKAMARFTKLDSKLNQDKILLIEHETIESNLMEYISPTKKKIIKKQG